MSYDEDKTFDKAEREMDKMIDEQRARDLTDRYWKGKFTDAVETIYVVMKDGQEFFVSGEHENKVRLSAEMIEKKLKQVEGKNYGMKDIDTIIHNHFRSPRFSSGDKKRYRRLKRFGFTGKFLMYSHLREQIYEYKPKERNK